MPTLSNLNIYIDSITSFPADEYAGKFTSVVDLNLFSGSSDVFRNAVGGYFFNQLDENNNPSVPPVFKKFLYLDNINPSIYSVSSYKGDKINRNIVSIETGEDVGDTVTERGVSSQSTILPFVKFVCHVEGDPTSKQLENVTSGNKYWEALFVGGTFDNQAVESIYSDNAFDEHYTFLNLPYENIETKKLKNGSLIRKITETGYDYNDYNPSYQDFVTGLDSEKQNLNWYFVNLIAIGGSLKQDIVNYYGLGDDDENITAKQISNGENIESALELVTANIAASGAPLTAVMNQRQSNLLFNSNAVNNLLLPTSEGVANREVMPFYSKFNINTEDSAEYVDIIKSEKYTTGFLKTLKEVFLEQTNDQLPLDSVQFTLNQRFLSSSINDTIDMSEISSETTAFRGVDFTELLLYSHNTIRDENEDFLVVDYENIETKTAYDTKGSYRAFNVRNSLNTINKTLSTFSGDDAAFYISDINSLMNLQAKTTDFDLEDLNSIQPVAKYNEVLAYRVEKIAGPVTGDSSTQNVIQNFWVFNDEELKNLNLIDTQTKYNSEYTYKIYAYYIVKGVKYQFSDLQLTRVVGTVREDATVSSDTDRPTGTVTDGIDTDNPITGYCVEYFDPVSGETTKDLLDGAVGEVVDPSVISSLAEQDQIRVRVSSVDSLTENPLPPYFANFVATIQPSLKLIEVPIQTKMMTITDHIPNKVNVEPSYEIKNTNRLIFNLSYQEFDGALYPQIISSNEAEFRAKYLESNDLTEISKLEKEPVSPVRYVDVYRVSEKPQSYSDFDGNFLATIDKKIENGNFAYKTCVFSDKVRSNTKYYYLFRTRSELGVEGYTSQIIEAELVNDGGYKYALFDIVNDEDLIVEKYKNISENVKKVLQVTPNISQLLLDDAQVDYSQPARTQIDKIRVGSAEETIWSKTFKLRLTSKKTGKKIDLNITYNDPSIKLEE
jgi:hypothetical protein